MARRRATKARSKSASAGARVRVKPERGKPAPAATDKDTLQQRLAALERERDALKKELERSRTRLGRLEQTQAQVRDRLAWALDTLRSILGGKA